MFSDDAFVGELATECGELVRARGQYPPGEYTAEGPILVARNPLFFGTGSLPANANGWDVASGSYTRVLNVVERVVTPKRSLQTGEVIDIAGLRGDNPTVDAIFHLAAQKGVDLAGVSETQANGSSAAVPGVFLDFLGDGTETVDPDGFQHEGQTFGGLALFSRVELHPVDQQ